MPPRQTKSKSTALGTAKSSGFHSRQTKPAKVVGKLASIAPPTHLTSADDQNTQIVTGVLVQNDFKLSLMAPEDLREYAGLTTTTITCKQRLSLSAAGIDLIKWALEGTFGSIDELPEMKKKQNGTTNGHDKVEEAAGDVEEVNKLVAAYLVMGCVTVRYYSNRESNWSGKGTCSTTASRIPSWQCYSPWKAVLPQSSVSSLLDRLCYASF